MRVAPLLRALALAAAASPAWALLPTVATPAPSVSSGSGLMQASFGMVLVIALIFALAWLARRFGLQRLTGSPLVKVVASASVGTRERVVIVEVDGQWLVLGVTPSQVNALHTLAAQPLPERAGGDAHTLGTRFSSALRDALGGRGPAQ